MNINNILDAKPVEYGSLRIKSTIVTHTLILLKFSHQ